jgi:hypothetical protein
MTGAASLRGLIQGGRVGDQALVGLFLEAGLFVSSMAPPAGKLVLFPRGFDPLVAGEAALIGSEGPSVT